MNPGAAAVLGKQAEDGRFGPSPITEKEVKYSLCNRSGAKAEQHKIVKLPVIERLDAGYRRTALQRAFAAAAYVCGTQIRSGRGKQPVQPGTVDRVPMIAAKYDADERVPKFASKPNAILGAFEPATEMRIQSQLNIPTISKGEHISQPVDGWLVAGRVGAYVRC